MQIPGNAQEPVKIQESDKMKKSDKMQEQKKKSTTLNRIGKVDKKIRIRMWAAGIFFVCLVLDRCGTGRTRKPAANGKRE